MNADELTSEFSDLIPELQTFGRFVRHQILTSLKKEKSESIISFNPKSRVKDLNSFIEKALYRGKEYTDPINDITDKVGIRFVVLLLDHIKIISKIVESSSDWEFSKDRDFDEERKKNPTTFSYQSIHYVVKNVSDRQYNGKQISKGLTCEIQIRTLLQHAYSEVTHDTIYKPKVKSNPDIHRKIARSMAFMEAADEHFVDAFNEIAKMETEQLKIITTFRTIYEKFAKPNYNKRLTDFLTASFQEKFEQYDEEKINKFINDNLYLKDIITTNLKSNLIFGQPIVLGLFMLIENEPHNLKNKWPLPAEELQPLFTYMGKAFNS